MRHTHCTVIYILEFKNKHGRRYWGEPNEWQHIRGLLEILEVIYLNNSILERQRKNTNWSFVEGGERLETPLEHQELLPGALLWPRLHSSWHRDWHQLCLECPGCLLQSASGCHFFQSLWHRRFYGCGIFCLYHNRSTRDFVRLLWPSKMHWTIGNEVLWRRSSQMFQSRCDCHFSHLSSVPLVWTVFCGNAEKWLGTGSGHTSRLHWWVCLLHQSNGIRLRHLHRWGEDLGGLLPWTRNKPPGATNYWFWGAVWSISPATSGVNDLSCIRKMDH